MTTKKGDPCVCGGDVCDETCMRDWSSSALPAGSTADPQFIAAKAAFYALRDSEEIADNVEAGYSVGYMDFRALEKFFESR